MLYGADRSYRLRVASANRLVFTFSDDRDHRDIMSIRIGYFIGTYEDWGGASRALLNFVRRIDRNRFQPVVVVTKRGQLVDQLDNERIEWLVWPTHDRGRNPLRYLADIWRAASFFRRHALHVLHINFGTIGWKPAEVLAARLLRI